MNRQTRAASPILSAPASNRQPSESGAVQTPLLQHVAAAPPQEREEGRKEQHDLGDRAQAVPEVALAVREEQEAMLVLHGRSFPKRAPPIEPKPQLQQQTNRQHDAQHLGEPA